MDPKRRNQNNAKYKRNWRFSENTAFQGETSVKITQGRRFLEEVAPIFKIKQEVLTGTTIDRLEENKVFFLHIKSHEKRPLPDTLAFYSHYTPEYTHRQSKDSLHLFDI